MSKPVSNYKGQEENVCAKIYDKLCELGIGTEISVSDLLKCAYGKEESTYCNNEIGWADDYGELIIYDYEKFDVLDRLEKKCKKHGYKLDFSKWDGMVAGTPYNLDFVFKEKRRKINAKQKHQPKNTTS